MAAKKKLVLSDDFEVGDELVYEDSNAIVSDEMLEGLSSEEDDSRFRSVYANENVFLHSNDGLLHVID